MVAGKQDVDPARWLLLLLGWTQWSGSLVALSMARDF
jgi:hypothetical protein